MMEEIYYKAIFGLLLFSFTLIRIAHSRQWKKGQKTRNKGKGREKALVSIVSIGTMIIPVVWIFTGLFDAYALAFPDWARAFGIVLSVFSLWFFHWVHKTLGKNWSPVLEIRKDHSLVTSGPYKRIRHPMYTQIWMWVFAQAIITANILVGLAGIFSWALLYFIRVPKEEAMMIEEFGKEYKDYMKRTGRVFPKLRGS
jgi:protein-S-isoprenylcysteine O-methyltransferase Ste14